jgi:hypothetical protein
MARRRIEEARRLKSETLPRDLDALFGNQFEAVRDALERLHGTGSIPRPPGLDARAGESLDAHTPIQISSPAPFVARTRLKASLWLTAGVREGRLPRTSPTRRVAASPSPLSNPWRLAPARGGMCLNASGSS